MKVKVEGKTIFCSIFFVIFCFNNSPSWAYENEYGNNRVKSVQSNQELKNLDIDQIIEIETIRQRYQGLINAYKQKLAAEQKLFNEGLRLDSDEKSIRKAFDLIASAMEDVAVCQVQMMQEINIVMNAHQAAQAEGNGKVLSPNTF